MMRRCRILLGVLCLSAGVANADAVDNPGFFYWDGNGGLLEFNQSSLITEELPSSGLWDTDIDSAGDVTTNAMSIAPVAIGSTGYTAQVLVTAGSTSVSLKASTGSLVATFTLRVRITGGTVGNSCITSSFTASTIDPPSVYTYTLLTMEGEVFFYTGWVTVPAFSAASCNNQGTAMNSLFGFGVAGQGLRMSRLHYRVANGPVGS